MRWWKHLYMGRKAAAGRPDILSGIREGRLMPEVYVITLPESGNHLLDVRPLMLLTKKERESSELLILGVAKGHGEACQVVRDMIDHMYSRTGGFDWKGYMELLDEEAQA